MPTVVLLWNKEDVFGLVGELIPVVLLWKILVGFVDAFPHVDDAEVENGLLLSFRVNRVDELNFFGLSVP